MDDLAATAPTWDELWLGIEMGLYGPPILCGLVAGLALGYLGVLVVLRRMVFVTAAVSQAAGLGVALAFFAGIHLGVEVSPVAGAVVLALVATVILGVPAERLRVSREAVLGVVYVACWAGAVLVGDRIAQESHDIAAILFGTAVLVRDVDLWLVLGAGALVLIGHFAVGRGVVFAAFDPESARVQGVPVRILDLGTVVLVALTVSVATRALGVLPVFAFAVLPALAGLVLSDRLRWVLPIAAVVGGLAGSGGYLVAFFGEMPVGASQAAVAAAAFLLTVPVRLARRGRVLG